MPRLVPIASMKDISDTALCSYSIVIAAVLRSSDMNFFFGFWTALLYSCLGLTAAQQLTDAYIPMSYPGLGGDCLEALNTSVACPAYLSPLSVKYAFLPRA